MRVAPWWWWQARPSDIVGCTETAAMFILAPFLLVAGIGFLCWLFFTVAVFALPCAMGLMAGFWAYGAGAGVVGGIIVGFVAGAATFVIGQVAFALVPWMWLKLLIVLLYTVPAIIMGYSTTHGIAQMLMPSPAWQLFFSIIGAIAVGVTAFIRFTTVAPPGPSGGNIARV
ncbi:hypothetical protein HKD27_13705 [Gluconobacter sp. R75690]|jgi:hypothetical protein|uniref:Uncharacterized protein n=12 Tax=Acetobacteraceae TaxID=433 RepID=A0A1U9KIY1_ACEAC|nr:hypothetical protein [Acetobacter aceti]MBF0851950.1 hypothetical protein [Gluconobacter sp. R75690]MBF0875552.1 hypothetical protein [Gluconobacter cerevisiae]MBF0880293.1 hypothetical protein [Gluconobacter sp. R75828]GBR08955.1 hypothetical protein AA21952_2736 [Acetobacter oeni LMG 21952]AQS85761.1 hypothetical protein A0U92_14370 [Acetobacter aceti]